MTVLYAYDQTDLEQYDLNYWYEFFAQQALIPLEGEAWEDVFELYAGSDLLSLYGYDFAYDPAEVPNEIYNMNQGYIQALSQWAWAPDETSINGGEWVERWHWSGWDDFSAETFYDAAQTETIDDDFDIIREVLSGDDTFYLSEFDDSFSGYKGNDTFYGNSGRDELYGLNGNDSLYGGSGGDDLYGGRGSDLVSGARGDDWLDGGNGNDVIKGGYGNDFLYGGDGTGNDELSGGRHADFLDGGAGDDTLLGGGGEDLLVGGEGNDELTGGAQMDMFEFSTGHGQDTITDFDAIGHVHDTIVLAGVDAITGWQDLEQNHMSQVGADVVIDTGNGDQITIENVTLGQLDEGDFDFSFSLIL